jgi:hypothetical protein
MAENPFGKDLGDLMSQLQQAQSQLQDIEKTMGDREVKADAGGGMVKVSANGRLEVLSVKIDPRAMDPGDPGMLEDLILTAVNRALAQARDLMAQEMSQGLFGGKLPGMF